MPQVSASSARSQANPGIHGDLLEIGVLYGKNAVVLAGYAR
jgi:hypothetical protein